MTPAPHKPAGSHEIKTMSRDNSIRDEKTRGGGPIQAGGGGPIQAVADRVADLGAFVIDRLEGLGSVALFALRTFKWLTTRLPRRETLLPCFYQVGVLSLPVVAATGFFIGVILAVQTYGQFRMLHMESRLGAVINLSLVRELGPVLAATMLAGSVGSAMASELGTMRVTEQIDALESMGANPIHYLVVPRFLSCLLLIPALTIWADLMGIVGGEFYGVYILGIDWQYYWIHAQNASAVSTFSAAFSRVCSSAAAISLISCYRGFHCDPGAEGVGIAATKAFVYSFLVILMLDVVLAIGLDAVYLAIWPEGPKLL